MHLVVMYGHQGGDKDFEQLGLTNLLFDAASCALEVIGKGQPTIIAGDFNIQPTKMPSLLDLGWALRWSGSVLGFCP